MINYKISTPKPHRKYIHFEARFPSKNNELLLQLPAWRPGRYELSDFAQYLRNLDFENSKGETLKAEKLSKDLWRIESGGNSEVVVKYDFYADQLNAGSSYIHEDFLYINPVNCFFYTPDNKDEEYHLELDLEYNFRLATGMKHKGNELFAKDHQELFDCPFIASKNIEQWNYREKDCDFHIWIQGDHPFSKEEISGIFKSFSREQIKAFGDIPCSEYHFLFIFPDFQVRHGVEHENSTVITIGPSSILQSQEWKDEFLAISSHELYHTWNIKKIRPKEMLPYDFSKENYSELGYVAEGVTTYMGEQFLLRSGYYDDEKFFNRYAATVKRHGHNYGRFNLSVAESSFDTWLDGYKVGTPWRKVSIYVEGSICAFVCDMEIISSSKRKYSLDNVMFDLYRSAKEGNGYSAENYRELAEKYAGKNLNHLFDNMIYGTEDYFPLFTEKLEEFGIKLESSVAKSAWTSRCGIILDKNRITLCAPDAPGDKAGLRLSDLILSINGIDCQENIENMFEEKMIVEYSRDGRIYKTELIADKASYFPEYRLSRMEIINVEQEKNFKFWKHR